MFSLFDPLKAQQSRLVYNVEVRMVELSLSKRKEHKQIALDNRFLSKAKKGC